MPPNCRVNHTADLTQMLELVNLIGWYLNDVLNAVIVVGLPTEGDTDSGHHQ
jgi:hypothetical protein